MRTALEDAAQLPAGVAAISWAGIGVYGISLDLNPDKNTDLKDRDSAKVKVTAGDYLKDPATGALLGGLSAIIPDAIDPSNPNDPPVRDNTLPAGVLGLSMQGAGVRGVSRFDRGAIFQSATIRNDPQFPAGRDEDETNPPVAQIRLVPHRLRQVDDRSQNPLLPRDGQTGDLLSVVAFERGNQRFSSAQLWFCVRGAKGNPFGAAQWSKVAFSDTVDGTI
jgi:hypothetical protein